MKITISPWDYDAVLFDLDGVLTKTARVHAAAWKKLFDDFLAERAAKTGEPFEAARRLGAEPARAVVLEDAIAGVAAGRAGRFGSVIGVDSQRPALAGYFL